MGMSNDSIYERESLQASDSFGSSDDGSKTGIAMKDSTAECEDEGFDDYESESFEDEEEVEDGDSPRNEDAGDSNATLALTAGKRVQVFWAEELAWFDGVIADSADPANEKHLVAYEDGDVAWEVLYALLAAINKALTWQL